MAERLTVLADLKHAFAKFDDMSQLIDAMRSTAKEINDFNKRAAGDDDIGEAYHKAVDEPTKALTDLLKTVRDRIDQTGASGQAASDGFDRAAQDAADRAHGM